MSEVAGKILPINIEDEMRKSYIDYAMSVIVGRALPDVRDGLKPVHRRILYAMYELNMTPDKPYKKSARLVGDVLGRYHPHGDSAVYDAMVRMAQDFNSRYPLVDGHGNFGSIDGDSAAAMRYTEARLSKIALEMLADIEKETVDFVPNYDDTLKEPTVLPSKIPNLLVNGSEGIAVGMATKIPPHNLREVIDGVIMLIDNPNADYRELMKVIKGPDFPTGAKILGTRGIEEAYRTGRGVITIRAQARIEKMNNGKMRIVVYEIPFQVNKAKLIEKIADLVKEKKIDGITDLRDESDRTGMRIIIELRRDVNPNVILNQLYKHTSLQETFGIIMLALVNGEPKVLNLPQVLHYYLEHQKDVIVRRTRYDLAKAEARAHIVEGLRIALNNLDAVIKTIRSSQTTEIARTALMEKFALSEKQAQAILDMRLQRLTGLEREKLENEYKDLLEKIAYYKSVLADERKVLEIIKDELTVIKEKYGDERRTIITNEDNRIDIEDLIEEEDVVITITHHGYIKRQPADIYKSQKRGGRGITAMGTKEEDFVEHLFIANTHHYLLFLTNAGKIYRLKVHEVPEAGRTAKGTALINLINIGPEEMIKAVIPCRSFDEDCYLLTATKKGIIKKTHLSEYKHGRKDGIVALTIEENDELIGALLTNGKSEIVLGSRLGMAIRFSEEEVRPMGRTAKGVRGITLSKEDAVVALDVVEDSGELLTVTENGFAKRTPLTEYRVQSRGGKGIKTANITDKSGPIVGLMVVKPGEEIMAISTDGIMIRTKVDEIKRAGRATTGVRLMKIGEQQKLASIAKVKEEEE
ncbi:DNA gyrase subunit A [Carboxydocella sporoproducens DSM 16521]|uniref:DNA gyrase subunit A n=2 Tax=Carboxydocella TaxID=178898 RepID=A0A1T4SBF9_9FIRM|nr:MULTISPECIES: DNA gyrase subunit A [Carboxydocella]AVX19225.1 DNA gyrase subunit A [Carboxydocella thermautotrophica]SKA25517.1 DNA gyrase subunit A [Carboxydocella sporoproducens DSM 16521]